MVHAQRPGTEPCLVPRRPTSTFLKPDTSLHWHDRDHGLPIQPDDRLDHQLPAPDRWLPPFPCSVFPAESFEPAQGHQRRLGGTSPTRPLGDRHQPGPPPPHRGTNPQISAPHTTSHVLWLPPRTQTCGQHRLRAAGPSPVRQPPPQQAIKRSGSHVPGNGVTPPPFPTAPYRPAGYRFHGQMPCNPVNAPSGESSDNPAAVRTTRYDNGCRDVRTSRTDPAPETATGSTPARADPT